MECTSDANRTQIEKLGSGLASNNSRNGDHHFRDVNEALEYFRPLFGNVPYIPIRKGTKVVALAKGWKDQLKKSWTETRAAPPYYSPMLDSAVKEGGNWGIYVGPLSGNLISIDIDDDRLEEEFLRYYPEAANTLRTHGSRGAQYWFRIKDRYPQKCKVLLNGENGQKGNKLIEWRGGECYSVIFGPHPDGRHYYQDNGLKPLEVPLSFFTDRAVSLPETWRANFQKLGRKPGRPRESLAKTDELERAGGPCWEMNYGGELASLDLVGLLKTLGCKLTNQGKDDIGAKYSFPCPWHKEHKSTEGGEHDKELDAVIWITTDSAPRFNCFHSHCADRRLKALLEWAESQEKGIVDRFCKKIRPWLWLPQIGNDSTPYVTKLGKILSSENFFNYRNKIVTVIYSDKDETHVFETVGPHAFRTDVLPFCRPYLMCKNGRVLKGLDKDHACLALASSQVKEGARKVVALNTVNLPIIRKDGRLTLLPEGYDEESMVLTKSAVTYPVDWSLKKASEYLRGLLREFCYKQGDEERAMSVLIASGLSLFCRHLLNSKDNRPGFLVDANREGAGKTLAVKIGLITVLGVCKTATMPKDDDEMRKRITTLVEEGRPELFLDNIKGHIKSAALDAIMTTASWYDRRLGTNDTAGGLHNLTVYLTGNGCKITADQRLRLLRVRLHLDYLRPEDRPIKHLLDESEILRLRPQTLAAYYALVRDWHASGGKELTKVLNTKFPTWTRKIGGILVNAGFAVPKNEPDSELGREPNDIEMEKLVGHLELGKRYTMQELVDLICKHQLFKESQERTQEMNKALGRVFMRYHHTIVLPGKRLVVGGSAHHGRWYSIVKP